MHPTGIRPAYLLWENCGDIMAKKKEYFKVDIADVDSKVFREWSKAEFAVWIVLKRFESLERKAWPSFDTITKLTGLSSRSITLALHSLEERHIIRAYRTAGRLNYYLILPPPMRKLSP